MSRRSKRSLDKDEEETNNYEAEPEDDPEDDEQEVTRCICGQDELNTLAINPQLAQLLQQEYQIKVDLGLFIQCDKCLVWQHGYCVGLFTDNDVPDKYWCELCKPEIHVFVYENNEEVRTLYKPVNDKRKKLHLDEGLRSKRQSPTADSKPHRKERRHYDDTYDEQLQKALRELAKESGIVLDEVKPEDDEERLVRPKRRGRDDSASEVEVKKKSESEREEPAEEPKPKPKKAKPSKPAKKKPEKKDEPQLSKEELINQSSRPRYVNDKLTIYELRKRTGAILEWLGRSQLELQEEKLEKEELFSYREVTQGEEFRLREQSKRIVDTFNENLTSMEKLTEGILAWEEKYGKYAP